MEKKNLRVAGMGDLVTDLSVAVEHFPIQPGRHQMVERLELQPGGMGNFLIAGQRIGMRMSAIDLMGLDAYGIFTLDAFREEGIDITSILGLDEASSRVVMVLADPGGQHAFLGYRKDDYPLQDLREEWKAALDEMDALFAVGYSLTEPYLSTALLDAMEYCRARGVEVFFDPGPMIKEIAAHSLRRAMQSAEAILLTEDELELITGSRDTIAARRLLEYGARVVCVKAGANGCTLVGAAQTVHCPGFVVDARDTSGAGDSFAAAFIDAYLQGWPLDEIGAFANVMGAVKVQKFGAGRNVPTLAEIEAFIAERAVSLPRLVPPGG